MTNHQSDRLEILARLDEINRLLDVTNDPDLRKVLEARRRELRDSLDKMT